MADRKDCADGPSFSIGQKHRTSASPPSGEDSRLAAEVITPHESQLQMPPSGTSKTVHPQTANRKKRTDRKIALLKRCGLFAAKTPGVEILRACTVRDLEGAYQLVHEIFVDRGFCRRKDHGMRLRVFEATPDMATFVAKSEGKIIGVLSVVGDSQECGLPSDQAFKTELDAQRSALSGARFCEWSNQVVASDFRQTNVSTELMRCAAAHVIKADYSHSIISVSAAHAGFYELLGFRQIGPERSYSADIDDPVVPLCLASSLYLSPSNQEDDLAGFVRRFMAVENPHLEVIDSWNSDARQLFTDSRSLGRLFGKRSNFLRNCELSAQAAIIRRWGPKLFRKVAGNTTAACVLAWVRTALEIAATAAKSRLNAVGRNIPDSHWPGPLRSAGTKA